MNIYIYQYICHYIYINIYSSISMSEYRYQLEKYRGPRTRHVCPQCHRKQSFTRYIDTHNNNEYISDNVGKCNRLDKCGYHYTPKQYFEDNPWTRSVQRPVVHYDRENGRLDDGRSWSKPQPRRIDYIPGHPKRSWRRRLWHKKDWRAASSQIAPSIIS